MSYQALRKHAENVNVYFEVKEASLKRLQMCDSSYVTFWKRQNYEHTKTSVVAKYYRGSGDEQAEPRGGLGQ